MNNSKLTKEQLIEIIKNSTIMKNSNVLQIKQSGIFEKYENFEDDKEIMLEAVKQNGHLLRYASNRLKDDKHIVLAAVNKEPESLEYASERLRDDEEVVLIAVKNNGLLLECVSERLKSDKDIVSKAVKNYPTALEYASEKIKNDESLLMIVVNYGIDFFEEINLSDWYEKKVEVLEEVRNLNDKKFIEKTITQSTVYNKKNKF